MHLCKYVHAQTEAACTCTHAHTEPFAVLCLLTGLSKKNLNPPNKSGIVCVEILTHLAEPA